MVCIVDFQYEMIFNLVCLCMKPLLLLVFQISLSNEFYACDKATGSIGKKSWYVLAWCSTTTYNGYSLTLIHLAPSVMLKGLVQTFKEQSGIMLGELLSLM